jgi:hypothetical protein
VVAGWWLGGAARRCSTVRGNELMMWLAERVLAHTLTHRGDAMPEISRFRGIIIRMYFLDHSPPHFHVQSGAHHAASIIESLQLLHGDLPRSTLALVRH